MRNASSRGRSALPNYTCYCTGWISNIGVPPPHGVMDFTAWIEVRLGGDWHIFDPRNNAPASAAS